MKIFTDRTVFEAAQARVARIFDEFENVLVWTSGGKDSTVIYELCLAEAEKRGRLPLDVAFIDQEGEWQATIDYVRLQMNDPRVRAHWYQVPMILFNATSGEDEWLHCWEEGGQWLREKEPNSIGVNNLGTNRFKEMFSAIVLEIFGKEKACAVGGVRAEESPARLLGLTSQVTYKEITWGKHEHKNREHYTLYPIYDWTYRDVWKAIHDNGWAYCKIYDGMYQKGVPIQKMRVSNVHHETAVQSLLVFQELEPDMWNRLTARMNGINVARHMGQTFSIPKEYPYMFRSWREYRDHLLENLIEKEENKEAFRALFDRYDARYRGKELVKLHKAEIRSLLVNDYHGTILETFSAGNPASGRKIMRRWEKEMEDVG